MAFRVPWEPARSGPARSGRRSGGRRSGARAWGGNRARWGRRRRGGPRGLCRGWGNRGAARPMPPARSRRASRWPPPRRRGARSLGGAAGRSARLLGGAQEQRGTRQVPVGGGLGRPQGCLPGRQAGNGRQACGAGSAGRAARNPSGGGAGGGGPGGYRAERCRLAVLIARHPRFVGGEDRRRGRDPLLQARRIEHRESLSGVHVAADDDRPLRDRARNREADRALVHRRNGALADQGLHYRCSADGCQPEPDRSAFRRDVRAGRSCG